MPIVVEGLRHVYSMGTPNEAIAVDGVDLVINDGDFVAIIGPTGSGKSTLIQHFNGLLKPTGGRVVVDGVDLSGRGVSLKSIRQKVGLIFQYPEHQLFEETVFADVAFGPRSIGLSEEEVRRRVEEALRLVGVDSNTHKRSPFELSGGQMRRVAIAGVLAMAPKVLILDEPTAGLDPSGRDEILAEIKSLHVEKGMSVVLVSHSMEDVARLAERVVVMHNGKVMLDGTTREVFREGFKLRSIGLELPEVTRLMWQLKAAGKRVSTDVLTIEEAHREILGLVRGRKDV